MICVWLMITVKVVLADYIINCDFHLHFTSTSIGADYQNHADASSLVVAEGVEQIRLEPISGVCL